MSKLKVNLYTRTGDVAREVELPPAFETPLRPDVIRKAVNAFQANRRQPYGAAPMAGKLQAEESWNPGRGVSRVPRQTQGRVAVFMPGSRGGRRAHPPKAERDWSEKINRKEKDLAFRSALAATTDPDTVRGRGHALEGEPTLPLVVEDLDDVTRTKDLLEILEALGLGPDLDRARQGRGIRAGKGKMRGRKYRVPTSLLLVTTAPDGVGRAAGNILGVDVRRPEQVNVEDLAPGGDPGRLTLLTESALEALEGRL